MPKSKKTFKKGDKVSWNTSQGKTTGTVQGKAKGQTKIKGHTAKPSKKNPEYIVKTEKSKKKAVHKPSELKKV